MFEVFTGFAVFEGLRRGRRAGSREAGLKPAERTVRRCVVCGSREVRTDAVELRGWVLLAECPHCDHRWTRALSASPSPAPERGAVRVAPSPRGAPEVLSAA